MAPLLPDELLERRRLRSSLGQQRFDRGADGGLHVVGGLRRVDDEEPVGLRGGGGEERRPHPLVEGVVLRLEPVEARALGRDARGRSAGRGRAARSAGAGGRRPPRATAPGPPRGRARGRRPGRRPRSRGSGPAARRRRGRAPARRRWRRGAPGPPRRGGPRRAGRPGPPDGGPGRGSRARGRCRRARGCAPRCDPVPSARRSSRSACVVFPAASPPSRVTKSPFTRSSGCASSPGSKPVRPRAGVFFGAGPFARLSASICTASANSTASGSCPRGTVTFVTPSVT